MESSAETSQHRHKAPAGDEAATGHSRWFHRALFRKAGIDQAVGFAVISRIWQLLTGPVTQLLIVYSFSSATQDYYYAFNNMLGMQVFVELGLHVVLISVSSHEWSNLSLHHGRIVGDASARSRLVSLGRKMMRWYGIAAVIFAATITVSGIYFFDGGATAGGSVTQARESVGWMLPWMALVLVNGLQLPLLPLTAILEGCNQLAVINRIRFFQALGGTFVVWIAIINGLGLWALVASASVRLGYEFYLVAFRYRSFFEDFRTPPQKDQVDWKVEILPLQWRIAVQGILLWLANSLPLLFVFKYRPEGEAAQLGMTWMILTGLQGASLAWIETRRPAFGALIAHEKYAELDRLFFRQTQLSMTAMTAAVAGFSLVVWWLGTRDEWLFERLSGRMLPIEATLLLSAAMVLMQFALCTNLYVRAHKRDPFLIASIISSLTVATLQVFFCRYFGNTGVALGYLLGVGCVQVPLWTLIWQQTRKEWHGKEGHHD